jgi:hypothetical protein
LRQPEATNCRGALAGLHSWSIERDTLVLRDGTGNNIARWGRNLNRVTGTTTLGVKRALLLATRAHA